MNKKQKKMLKRIIIASILFIVIKVVLDEIIQQKNCASDIDSEVQFFVQVRHKHTSMFVFKRSGLQGELFSIDMRAGFRNRTPSANLAAYLWASFFACSTKMLSTTSCKLVLANRASAAVCAS